MEQQQFKVSFSLGTKLLISVVLLLFVVILFLNLSTIFILREDKRAYTYQSQSTQTVLAGKEFVSIARHTIDSLRHILLSIDPRKPITSRDEQTVQALLQNQREISLALIGSLDPKSGKVKPLLRAAREKEPAELGLQEKDFSVPEPVMISVIPELLRNSFAFVNLSKIGGPPMIGTLVADLKLADAAGGVPVAIGVGSLKGFGASAIGDSLSVLTKSGWTLFDTDPALQFSQRRSDDPFFLSALKSQVASGAQEFDEADTHYLGSYVQPGFDLIVMTRTKWEKAIRATYTLMEKFLFLGMSAIAAGVIFAILFSKTLTAPITRLYQATRDVAAGNFNLHLEAATQDEIGALTGSFNVMSQRIVELIHDSVEKVQLESELAIASTVQQTLIPPNHFENDRIQISSHYQAAAQCGGDWWGYFGVGKKMCLMISDATGHGFPSALITASARSCFSCMHKLAQEDEEFSFSPSAMLSYANRVIYDASLGKIMMTFFIAVIDFEKNTLQFSNAGHNPPWLFKREGGKYKLSSMVSAGRRLGESRDLGEVTEHTLSFGEGDMLFMYTDGITEGKDTEGKLYGKKAVRRIVEGSLAQGPEKVVSSLMADFLKHNQGKPLDDDVTLAVAKFL